MLKKSSKLLLFFTALFVLSLMTLLIPGTEEPKSKVPSPKPATSARMYRDPIQLTVSWWGPNYIATVDQYGHEEPAKMPVKVQIWQQVEFLHKQGNPEYTIPQGSTGPWLRYITTRMSPYGTSEVYEVQFSDTTFNVYLQCQQLGSQQASFDSHQ